MKFQYIKTRMEHDTAVFTFNRPKPLKAFNKDMTGEINAVSWHRSAPKAWS